MGQTDESTKTAADILVGAGLIDADQLVYAKRVHAKLGDARPLTRVLIDLYDLDDEAIRKALVENRTRLRLGDLLVELGQMSPEDLERALAIQREDFQESGVQRRLGEIVVEHHFISSDEFTNLLALHLGLPVEEPELDELTEPGCPRIPVKWCLEHDFAPVRWTEDGVVVAFADPTSPEALRAAEEVFGTGKLIPAIGRRRAIRDVLAALRPNLDQGPAQSDESAVVDAVDGLLRAAIEEGASDIHIEPGRHGLRVRFRVDGVLMNHRDLPASMANPNREPNSRCSAARISPSGVAIRAGASSTRGASRRSIWRVSIYITVHGGEDRDASAQSRSSAGLGSTRSRWVRRCWPRFREDALLCPSGVLIITGPTGSGKTTTLYSCVNEIRNSETSIITAEDPVEYVIDGIAQCSINQADRPELPGDTPAHRSVRTRT